MLWLLLKVGKWEGLTIRGGYLDHGGYLEPSTFLRRYIHGCKALLAGAPPRSDDGCQRASEGHSSTALRPLRPEDCQMSLVLLLHSTTRQALGDLLNC